MTGLTLDVANIIVRPQIAHGKAAGALALGVSSRLIAETALERPTFVNALASQVPFGLVAAAGGVIIVDAESSIVGAIGVTGDTSDNDEVCALAGIAAGGLAAQSQGHSMASMPALIQVLRGPARRRPRSGRRWIQFPTSPVSVAGHRRFRESREATLEHAHPLSQRYEA